MKYFTIKELTRSSTATRLGIDNTPNEKEVQNLTALVENILDPLREEYGKPININSGFRGKKLNKAVGGAKMSQHLQGKAADISVGSIRGNKLLFDLIMELNLPYDQLINEYNFKWLHVSYNGTKNRRQVLNIG